METDQETEHCFPLSAIPASPCMSSLTPGEGVSLTCPLFDSWISLSCCLTRAQRRARANGGDVAFQFGRSSLHSVEVFTH